MFLALLIGLGALAVGIARAARQGGSRSPRGSDHFSNAPGDFSTPLSIHSASVGSAASDHASSTHDGSTSASHDCGCDSGSSSDGGGSCGCD